MIIRRKVRTNRWITIVKYAAAVPLIQFVGCSIDALPQVRLADIERALREGLVQSLTSDVFSVAQTILLNVFRV